MVRQPQPEVHRTTTEPVESPICRFPLMDRLLRSSFGVGVGLPGIATIAIYVAFCWMYAEGAHTHSRLLRELFIWPACLGLMACYIWGAWRLSAVSHATPRHWRWVIGLGIGMGLLCWLLPPFHSTDVFGYINRGWQQWAYQGIPAMPLGWNPYVTTVGQLPGWETDPMITDHWVNNPCPYGFAFAHLARGWVSVFSGNLAATLGLVKACNLLWLWGITALVAWLAAQWNDADSDSEKQAIALRRVYWLSWHPLLLIHHVANGHNDLYMGGLLLAAIAASAWPKLKTLQWPVATVLATTSVLVKYATGLVFPIIGWAWLCQQKWDRLLFCLLLAGLTAVAWGIPYLQDWPHFQLSAMGENATLPHSSLHALLVFFVNIWLKLFNISKALLGPWISISRALLMLAFAGVVGWVGVQIHKTRATLDDRTLWAWALSLLAVFVGLVSSKFYPWYLGMILPAVLALRGNHPLVQTVWIVAIAQVLGVTVLGQARMADVLLMTLTPLSLWAWWRYGKGAQRMGPHQLSISG